MKYANLKAYGPRLLLSDPRSRQVPRGGHSLRRAGGWFGAGLSKLTASEETSSPLFASSPAARPATTGAPVAKGPDKRREAGPSETIGPGDAEPQGPRIRVLSSTLVPTTSPSVERRRGRVRVRVRVTARDDKATLGTARFISGDDELEADPKTKKAAGNLLGTIAAGKSATGELRFETSGALTDRLADKRRAKLRIGHRTCRFA